MALATGAFSNWPQPQVSPFASASFHHLTSPLGHTSAPRAALQQREGLVSPSGPRTELNRPHPARACTRVASLAPRERRVLLTILAPDLMDRADPKDQNDNAPDNTANPRIDVLTEEQNDECKNRQPDITRYHRPPHARNTGTATPHTQTVAACTFAPHSLDTASISPFVTQPKTNRH